MAYVKQITIHSTLSKSIKYIVNPGKTDESLLVTGLNCAMNAKLAYRQMQFTKKQFSKNDKVLGYHFVQSFKPGEISDVNLAHKLGVEWADKISDGKYQMIVSTHIDKGHIHNHFVMNSVNFQDGKKFDSNKAQLEEIRKVSDKLCEEYGLSIIERNSKNRSKHYKEWVEDKKGGSWKSRIKSDIDNLINGNKIKSFEELVEELEERGYEVKYKQAKHITFKAPGQTRCTRGKTLGDEYTEAALIERISAKENDLEFIKYKNKDKRQWVDKDIFKFKYKRGTLANNIEITSLIIKNMLGIGNENKAKNKTNKEYALKSLKQLEKALLIMENNNIETLEQVHENIIKSEQDNKLINKYINRAMIKINEISEIEKLIVKIEEQELKLNEYTNSVINGIKYKKEFDELKKNKKELEEKNIHSRSDIAEIKKEKEVFFDGIAKCNQKISENDVKKKEYLELLDIIEKVNKKIYIDKSSKESVKTDDNVKKGLEINKKVKTKNDYLDKQ